MRLGLGHLDAHMDSALFVDTRKGPQDLGIQVPPCSSLSHGARVALSRLS